MLDAWSLVLVEILLSESVLWCSIYLVIFCYYFGLLLVRYVIRKGHLALKICSPTYGSPYRLSAN